MNFRSIGGVLSYLLILLGLCLAAPLVVSIFYKSEGSSQVAEILSFSITIFICLTSGLLLRKKFKKDASKIGRREGFAIVTFAWLIVVVVGMIPYLISGVTDSVTDAFFETMSGFTTTGASVFGDKGNEIESIPRGVQFWRCMTQWLGGMGIVVMSVAILSFLGAAGYKLVKAETPGGVAFEREHPRITDSARDMWKIYIIISTIQMMLLRFSGLSFYDAICHTFTTMSTGGFSPYGDSAAHFGPAAQWIMIVFMLLAGVNFSLHAQVFRGNFRSIYTNSELRAYLGIIAVCCVIGIGVVSSNNGIENRIRESIFQVVSITTTTGYATADFDSWPQFMRIILVSLMFCGGCMGSTGGGMKVARILIYFKALKRELHRLIYPHAVRPIRFGYKVVDRRITSNILAFGGAYLALFLIGVFVMAAFDYDLVTCLSASAAAIGNIGPGLGDVGPSANWSHLPSLVKWVMSFLMLLGRLEVYSVLILFTGWIWKR